MGDSPFKLVSMTIKSIDVPWSLVKLNWGEVKIDGIEVLLMPAPTQRDNDSNSKDNPIEESTSNRNSLNFSAVSFYIIKWNHKFGKSI